MAVVLMYGIYTSEWTSFAERVWGVIYAADCARIEPEDETRKEVLSARVDLYMAAKKWDMAAAVASHLVKVEPENAAWWINLAYATRRAESVEKAEAILLQACELHHDNAMIEFNLACYASVTGRFEEAKARLKRAIELNKDIRQLALDDEDLSLYGIGLAAWTRTNPLRHDVTSREFPYVWAGDQPNMTAVRTQLGLIGHNDIPRPRRREI